MKRKEFTECEVCGTNVPCIETRDGMYVCSKTCKQIAEGTGSNIPIDVMLRTSPMAYMEL